VTKGSKRGRRKEGRRKGGKEGEGRNREGGRVKQRERQCVKRKKGRE